ncbi:MAG TPA: hypothetical protein VHT92_11690 [Candidatus Cybelea sp.]|nr:hypothetical protein [Candidatus Cybelea sp.]
MTEDLILLPEVEARRLLGDRQIRLQLLAPYGAWIGYGTLRVLRVRMNEDRSADVTVGYESYRK